MMPNKKHDETVVAVNSGDVDSCEALSAARAEACCQNAQEKKKK